MIRLVFALVLLAHGIGHSMGPLQVLKVATVNPSWGGDSWLLSGLAGTPAAQAVGIAAWSVSIVGFAALAMVVVGWLPESWWAPLAIASSVVSIAGLLLFPGAFPMGSTVGCALVDIAVLAAVLWFRWTPGQLPV